MVDCIYYISDYILDALRSLPQFAHLPIKDTEIRIQKYLKDAKDRSGGRRRREVENQKKLDDKYRETEIRYQSNTESSETENHRKSNAKDVESERCCNSNTNYRERESRRSFPPGIF